MLVDNRIEKLNSQTTELRELALARNNNVTVSRTLNPANENITNNSNVDIKTTTCSPVGTIGN
jgi:hypothetical protein